MILVEYLCPSCPLRFELLQSRPAPDVAACPECSAPSPWTPSAPKVHMPVGTVVTGGSQERPPHALDTRPLAEGMPHREWHKAEREKDRKETYSRIKREM